MITINTFYKNYFSNRSGRIINDIDSNPTKKIRISKFGRLYLYFMLYSFLGWVWEKTFTLAFNGELREIGFLHIPVCIIYGVGASLILFLFYEKNYNWITIFWGCTVVICLLEFFTSWEMEKLFHRVWWDYSAWICNLQGRISLISSLAFGVFGLAVVKWGHTFLYKLIDKHFQKRVYIIIGFILLTVTIVDFIFTTSTLLK